MRKRKKASFTDIPAYYNFIKYNGGTLYYLCNRITDKEKAALLALYNNIEFFTIVCEYAPELVHNGILIK